MTGIEKEALKLLNRRHAIKCKMHDAKPGSHDHKKLSNRLRGLEGFIKKLLKKSGITNINLDSWHTELMLKD